MLYVFLVEDACLFLLFPFGWLLNKKVASIEVNLLLAFLYWIGIALHP